MCDPHNTADCLDDADIFQYLTADILEMHISVWAFTIDSRKTS